MLLLLLRNVASGITALILRGTRSSALSVVARSSTLTVTARTSVLSMPVRTSEVIA